MGALTCYMLHEPVSLMSTNEGGCSGQQQKIRNKLTKTVERNVPLIVFGRTVSGGYIAALWLQGTEAAKLATAWTFTPTYEGHLDLKPVLGHGTECPHTLDDIWVQHAAIFKDKPAPEAHRTNKKRRKRRKTPAGKGTQDQHSIH